ncbi:MAG: FAD-dependent oxidoreductase [Acidobacteriota bacterium]
MSEYRSRQAFYDEHPNARAWAALDHATNQQKKITPGPVKLRKGQFEGKRALILGSGVAGLTTAYELLAQETGMEVTVLEALGRTGGRCLTLRTGDTLTEDEDSRLFDSKPSRDTQVVRFKRPVGDSEPYLNAGPGRIPSSHKRLLTYLKEFGVDVEVYVMNSEANLLALEDSPIDESPLVYRRVNHNVRGWIAQMVYENAPELLASAGYSAHVGASEERVEQLRSLMVTFGDLISKGPHKGRYVPEAGAEGDDDDARSRAGFDVLPGVHPGKIADAIGLDKLLESKFWEKTRFYQPVDFLWQPTLFQPVGGMDRVQHAFAQQVAALGGTVHLNSPVQSIDWDPETREFVVQAGRVGTSETTEYRADCCFSNIAIPFLKRLLSPRLQSGAPGGFSAPFRAGLEAVFKAQFDVPEGDGSQYVARFLADTTKVGWQAERDLWQGSSMATDRPDSATFAAHSLVASELDLGSFEAEILGVPGSEVGVVPIFGGISWTEHEIVQIWYPSEAYHDRLGVLTGAYNFSRNAFKWGRMSVEERLRKAREGAAGFGEEFARGLGDGVAIAWQNMPHIKGGWAQWYAVQDSADHFNQLVQGTGIVDERGEPGDPVFFIVGDQLSSLPGWQEGAIASALNALSRYALPEFELPYLLALPDSRIIVEGL